MNKFKSVLGVFLLAFGLPIMAKEYQYQTVEGDLMNARIYTLDNGLKVYLSVNDEKPRIQTYIAVRTGSRNDPPETTGLAHYLEHLMFKGTRQFGTSDIDKEAPLLDAIEKHFEVYRTLKDPDQRRAYYHEIDSISQLAARYFIPNEYDKLMSAIGAVGTNAYTSNDVTCYIEDIPANEVENWARIVYEEYNIGLGSDTDKLFNALMALLFPGHPYGTQTTIGTQEHLKNPSITNIKNYFRRYYVPNNVAICMAGDFDPDQVIATLDKYFGTWQPNPSLSQPQYAPIPDRTMPKDTTVVGQEAERVYMAWKFDKAASFQNDTLDVIADMLSNGKAGLMDLNLDQQMKWLGGGAFTLPLAEYSGFVVAGFPKEGQSLDEVKALLLDEIGKLKKGDFDEDLIQAVVNNKKLSFYTTLESNEGRADLFVNAFINHQKWSDVTGKMDRISKITKQQIIDFANRHFRDNYVTVYKRIGNDSTIKKIDKPQITPIPTNRDMQSAFVTEIVNAETAPIQPKFVNFDKDLTKGMTSNGLPVLYVKNNENGRFSLNYYFDCGEEWNKWLPYAADYLDYLGTDKLSAEQLKQKFYQLACDFDISIGSKKSSIALRGLSENMTKAMALMEDFIAHAQVDTAAFTQYAALEMKGRADNKLDQQNNFSALQAYSVYGAYNPVRNIPSAQEFEQIDPQELVDLIRNLSNYKHTVLYYGPMNLDEVTAWNADRQPVIALFNEYFGGGMNTIVFQELREARGLAYSAGASYVTPAYKDKPEYATTFIISQNDKMMDCIRTFNQIIDTIPQAGKAFDLAKQALLKRLATARTTKMNIINAYLNATDKGIDYDINEKIYNTVPSLTMDDIVRFEQETMAGKPYRYIILGNEKELDIKSLEKIGPVKRLTTEEIFGY